MAEKSHKSMNKYKNDFANMAYDRVNLQVRKGNKDVLKDYASEKGMSVNALINSILADNVPEFQPFSFDYSEDEM